MLICDTSGRLHTNFELMEELAACKEALGKRMQSAPHEVLLVLDGTTGELHQCLSSCHICYHIHDQEFNMHHHVNMLLLRSGSRYSRAGCWHICAGPHISSIQDAQPLCS